MILPPAGTDCDGKPAAQTPTVTATPTGSANTTTTDDNKTNVNATNNATVGNNITGNATSGNAAVVANTHGGSAQSGDANSLANVINMLQSSSNLGNVATFTTNVDGDVQGDLVIDPSMLQPTTDVTALNDVDVNIANTGTINNKLRLDATSGDATVSQNTVAGGATSGNAKAMANVVNMMNSLVSANQSFIGTININGNLNGNILMPQSFLDQMIASNAPHQDVNVSQNTLNSLAANLSDNTNIKNTVNSTANTGAANVSANTNAGNATSGSAENNVTVFNISNRQVSGGNTMLVFVNVVGKWVGVIMDAPAGSTAAALGGGLNSNTTVANNANYNISNNGSITNDIGVNAKSGDARVSENTNAGGATSGNAQTAVNIANMTNDQINLTGWFGILFINVFGNWNGNFGVATNVASTNGAGSGGDNQPANAEMFGFKPTGNNYSSATSGRQIASSNPYSSVGASDDSATGTGVSTDLARVAGKVLGASTTAVNKPGLQTSANQGINVLIIAGGIIFAIGIAALAAGQRRSDTRA